MKIEGAVAVVTGGATGLGLATVETLRKAGAQVVVLGHRPPPLADDVAFAEADILDESVLAYAMGVAAAMGPLRILVHCAGTSWAERVLSREGAHGLDTFRTIVDINLVGTFNVLRLAAEKMAATEPIDGERGVIITTSSGAAFDGQAGQAAYAASKGAVAAMTLPLARDLASRLIRVVSVAPGLFDTPLLGLVGEEAKQKLAEQTPHPKRLGRPEEYAALVAHIIENPMLNGEVIRLDGAFRLGAK